MTKSVRGLCNHVVWMVFASVGCAFVLAAATVPVTAWGNEGHRAVALAALKVSDLANKVKDLAGADLPAIATCADEVRELEDKQIDRLSPVCAAIFPKPPKGTGNWHFVNLDVRKPPMNNDQMDKFCKQDCVVDRILFFHARLRDASSKQERRQALAFLVHFVGDIHQPLHSAERDNDFGGGGVEVLFNAAGRGGKTVQQEKLHGVWDSGIIRNVTADAGKLVDGMSAEIAEAKKETVPAAVGPWVHQWARDSQAIAIAHAYRDKGVEIPAKANPRHLLTPAYEAAAIKDIKSQIAKAGFRLAKLLETSLK